MGNTLIPHVTMHVTKWDDDWGLGQIDIKTINKMVKVGDEIGLTFSFAKTVTAMDDETYKERTVTASKRNLFVYPSDKRDLTDFWLKVEGKNK